jgi:cytochrome b561
MAATGAWLYTQKVPGGIVLQVHRAFANLMWAFVIAHAGVALLHQVMGHAVLQRMFGRRTEFQDADGVGAANSCSSRRQP